MQIGMCPSGTHQVPARTVRCPWCAIDAERAARRAHRTGPVTVRRTPPPRQPAAAQPSQDLILGMTHSAYLRMLAIVVVGVVIIAIIAIVVILSA